MEKNKFYSKICVEMDKLAVIPIKHNFTVKWNKGLYIAMKKRDLCTCMYDHVLHYIQF